MFCLISALLNVEWGKVRQYKHQFTFHILFGRKGSKYKVLQKKKIDGKRRKIEAAKNELKIGRWDTHKNKNCKKKKMQKGAKR